MLLPAWPDERMAGQNRRVQTLASNFLLSCNPHPLTSTKGTGSVQQQHQRFASTTMAGRNAKLLALVLVIQLVCWRGKASLQSLHRSGASDEVNVPTQHHLARRSFEVDASNGGALYELLQSLPSLPADSHHGKKDDKKKKKHDSKKHDKKHDEKKHTSHHSTTSHSHTSTTSHATTTTTTSSSSSSTTSSSTTTAAPHKHTQVRSCHPLPLDVPPENLCAHIIQYCPPSGHVDYLRTYYCAGTEPTTADPPDDDGGAAAPLGPGIATRRGAALAGIIFWMLLLFSTVGIVASDFFCPNLSTLAARLGLNESTVSCAWRSCVDSLLTLPVCRLELLFSHSATGVQMSLVPSAP